MPGMTMPGGLPNLAALGKMPGMPDLAAMMAAAKAGRPIAP